MVEGAKVLTAALDAGAAVESLYYSPEALRAPAALAVLERAAAAGVRAFPLQGGVLERVADTVTPQPLCGIVAAPDRPLGQLLGGRLLLVCVDVRDPGNLGAILRSADAAGAGGVVCCEGGADPHSPKVVRASAGALFSLPLASAVPAGEALRTLGEAGYRRLAAQARGGQDYARAPLGGRVALLLGNEARGLPEELARELEGTLTIPMAGRAESLNVAMAATLLAFEVARRHRLGEASEGEAVEPLA